MAHKHPRASVPGLVVRIAALDEHEEVCRLVREVFRAQSAVGFEPDGLTLFEAYAEPGAMAERVDSGQSEVTVAEQGDELLGVLEMRGPDHVALFFVKPSHQGRGVGRALFARCLEAARAAEVPEIGVHSSCIAREVYAALGFVGEQVRRTHGMVYVPMILKVHPEP